MLTSPFWSDDFPRPGSLPTGAPEGRYDVAVIGAGVTGLTAARRLAGSGATVAVLDSSEIGSGASSINGGMIIYGLKAGQADVIRRFGNPLAAELWQASLDSIDLVEEIVTAENIDCSFARTGSGALGLNGRDVRVMEENAEWLRSHLGFDARFSSGAAVAAVAGGDRFTAAVTENVSAGVHPARYTFGLAAAAARAGATLIEDAEVTDSRPIPGGHTLETPRGSIEAGEVLMATNGYTGHLFPKIRRGVVPIGSYSVVTAPLPDDVAASLIPGRRMLWTSRRFLNYFRLTPDNRLLMGGRANLNPDLDLERSGELLRSTIAGFFPDLADVEITHSWGGRLGATFDLLPHIGNHDGIWYALGYGGHGLGIGTYLGHEVAGLINGELSRSPFAEIPHPTRFYYRKRPWFLPAGALAFRALDALGR
jgi:glycine/D-amino acid oxidase-like deaminating enzyme